MSDDYIINAVDKEHVKKLKRDLESWRDIMLKLHSVLLWEQNWYPGLIIGISSALFMLLWLVDPSILSAISSAGIIVTSLDFLVPTMCASLFSPANWNGTKEKQFEDICTSLIYIYTTLVQQFSAFRNLKTSNPKLYYAVTITGLIVLTFIGNKLNNLLLSYMLVTSLLLLPGLTRHGILRKYYQLILKCTTYTLKSLRGGGVEKFKAK